MILTYWQGDATPLGGFIADWSAAVAEPTVMGDDVVESILESIDKEWVETYRRIRIPACRSDIARFALLYQFGGLYVDAHTGKPDLRMLVALLGKLAEYDAVLATAPHPKIPRVIQNGAILARKGTGVVVTVLSSLMENLSGQRDKEARGACSGGYNIAAMTGAWAVRMCLFKRDRPELIPYPQFNVATFAMDPETPRPFRFHVHYGYRAPGMHWSERQAVEPLFEVP